MTDSQPLDAVDKSKVLLVMQDILSSQSKEENLETLVQAFEFDEGHLFDDPKSFTYNLCWKVLDDVRDRLETVLNDPKPKFDSDEDWTIIPETFYKDPDVVNEVAFFYSDIDKNDFLKQVSDGYNDLDISCISKAFDTLCATAKQDHYLDSLNKAINTLSSQDRTYPQANEIVFDDFLGRRLHEHVLTNSEALLKPKTVLELFDQADALAEEYYNHNDPDDPYTLSSPETAAVLCEAMLRDIDFDCDEVAKKFNWATFGETPTPLLWNVAQDYSRDLAIQLSFIPALQEYCRNAPEDLAETLSNNPLWKPFQEIDYAMETGHELDDYFDTEKSQVFLHLMDSIPQLSLSDENAILMTASQNHGSLNVLCRLVMFKTDFDSLVKELDIDESALIEKYADDENIQNCITCSLAERMDKVDNPLREKHLRGWWDKVPTNPTLFALDLNTSRQVLLEDNEQQHTARHEIALTQTHKRR